MSNNKFVRFDEAIHTASDRCEATQKVSQCVNCKIKGSNYCAMHGGNRSIDQAQKKAINEHRLNRWQTRAKELGADDDVKSLRDEIGVLRMILEEMFGQCSSNLDILLYSQRMSDLVMKIEKLVSSCDKLENRMGQLLSKDSILQLASMYVNIINLHVSDPQIIEDISADMVQATQQIGAPISA